MISYQFRGWIKYVSVTGLGMNLTVHKMDNGPLTRTWMRTRRDGERIRASSGGGGSLIAAVRHDPQWDNEDRWGRV